MVSETRIAALIYAINSVEMAAALSIKMFIEEIIIFIRVIAVTDEQNVKSDTNPLFVLIIPESVFCKL